MKKLILLVASLFFLITQLIGKEKINYELYSVAFYNVENLFDTIPEPNDHEYTPTGAMQWDSKKYWAKSYPITDYKRYAFANSGAVRLRHISYSRNVMGN